MGCTGPHTEGCRCRSEIFWEAYDILKTISHGLDNYMKTLKPHEVKELRAHVPCINSLRTITRRIGGFYE